ncbi:MAG: hypothetical protein FJ147_00470 [Deltaproteobacteria bacterium]|nr:hypothetical protein [Deltaproteobacteria bacterium]
MAVLIPLAGCVTAYRPENMTGGYTNLRLAEHAYRVRFKGNNYTSREKVEQFLLYRCAQLTRQLGYEHFVIVAEDTIDISDLFAQAGLFPRNYHATAHIKVLADPDHPAAYNAKDALRRIEAQYPNELGSLKDSEYQRVPEQQLGVL